MPKSENVRSFTQVLAEIAKGQVQAELSTQLAGLIRAVEEHAKTGSLTLKISVVPGKHAQPGAELDHVTLQAEISCKQPMRSFQGSLFFVDEDGALTRDNPRQADIESIPGVRSVT